MAKVYLTQGEIHGQLYGFGLTWFSTGNLSQTIEGIKKDYFYFKMDKLSKEKAEEITKTFPQAEFFVAQSQYAPEQRSSLLAFPRKTRLYMLDHAN